MADDTILFETLSKVLVHAQDIILSTVFDHARRPPTVASLMAPSSSSKGGNARYVIFYVFLFTDVRLIAIHLLLTCPLLLLLLFDLQPCG
jgi:hypothetical protein